MADRQKKREGQKYKNLKLQKYLENEKSFLLEIKSIFHNFCRAVIWWKKNKNLMKIADTSFKVFISLWNILEQLV